MGTDKALRMSFTSGGGCQSASVDQKHGCQLDAELEKDGPSACQVASNRHNSGHMHRVFG